MDNIGGDKRSIEVIAKKLAKRRLIHALGGKCEIEVNYEPI